LIDSTTTDLNSILIINDEGAGCDVLYQSLSDIVAPCCLLSADLLATKKADDTSAFLYFNPTSKEALDSSIPHDEWLGTGASLRSKEGLLCIGNIDKVFLNNAKDSLSDLIGRERNDVFSYLSSEALYMSKGGHTVIANAKPAFGYYQSQKNFFENARNIPIELLKQFDLIFLQIDTSSVNGSIQMCESLLSACSASSRHSEDPFSKGSDMYFPDQKSNIAYSSHGRLLLKQRIQRVHSHASTSAHMSSDKIKQVIHFLRDVTLESR
jgi:MCM P-loop domain